MRANTVRTTLLVALALLAFAANSLLCRMALADGRLGALQFTSIRLVSGALCLTVLVAVRGRGETADAPSRWRQWPNAMALAGYAVSFSFAYLQLPTGVGALILFGCVQVTMVLGGLFRGERPGAVEWLGLSVSLAGLLYLLLPGATAPAVLPALLMAAAGICWGFYSLLGRGVADPVRSTAANFVLTVPLALPVALWGLASAANVDSVGVLLAVLSGAVASGLGYAVWYAALARTTATRAAIAQLAVPVLAALAGVALLGEELTQRLVLAAVLILGGIGLATTAKKHGEAHTPAGRSGLLSRFPFFRTSREPKD